MHRRFAGSGETPVDESSALSPRLRAGDRTYSTTSSNQAESSEAAIRATGKSPQASSRRSPPGKDGTHDDDDNDEQQQELPVSWWGRAVEKYGTIELENKGSVARDHLALERTFLAWLRTSLSFASIGIAITQVFRLRQDFGLPDRGLQPMRLRHVGKPLGATFLGVAILVLLIGFHRYFESQHYVRLGKFPASRASIALLSFVSGALVVASLIVILAIAPSGAPG